MPSRIIEIPFSSVGAEGHHDEGMIQFDPNWDMSGSCFVPSLGVVAFNDNTAVVHVAVGAVQPVDVATQCLVGSWRFGTADSVDLVKDLVELDKVYLAKGFSGWSVSSSGDVTGTIYLFGDLVACSDTIMALVTFDYSSLVSVDSGRSVVASSKR